MGQAGGDRDVGPLADVVCATDTACCCLAAVVRRRGNADGGGPAPRPVDAEAADARVAYPVSEFCRRAAAARLADVVRVIDAVGRLAAAVLYRANDDDRGPARLRRRCRWVDARAADAGAAVGLADAVGRLAAAVLYRANDDHGELRPRRRCGWVDQAALARAAHPVLESRRRAAAAPHHSNDEDNNEPFIDGHGRSVALAPRPPLPQGLRRHNAVVQPYVGSRGLP